MYEDIDNSRSLETIFLSSRPAWRLSQSDAHGSAHDQLRLQDAVVLGGSRDRVPNIDGRHEFEVGGEALVVRDSSNRTSSSGPVWMLC